MRARIVGGFALLLALACGKSEPPALRVVIGAEGGGPVPAQAVEVVRTRAESAGAVVVEVLPDGAVQIGFPASAQMGEAGAALVQRDALSMWLVDDGASATLDGSGPATLEEARRQAAGAAVVENTSGYGERWLVLAPPPVATDADVVSAEVTEDYDGRAQVSVQLDPDATRRFGDVTAANVGKRLAIVRGGACVSAPVVREAIRGGSVSIDMGTGDPDAARREARALAAVLSSGALAVPLEIRSIDTW